MGDYGTSQEGVVTYVVVPRVVPSAPIRVPSGTAPLDLRTSSLFFTAKCKWRRVLRLSIVSVGLVFGVHEFHRFYPRLTLAYAHHAPGPGQWVNISGPRTL